VIMFDVITHKLFWTYHLNVKWSISTF